MTRRIWWMTSIALGGGLLLVASGPHAHASQAWSDGVCPPGDPLSYCLVAEGPGTWTFLDRSWTALGILVHPGSIEIRNPYTGQATGRVDAPGPRRFTGLPAFSPDGRLLAATLDDGTLRVWEVGSGRELWTLPSRTEGSSAAFGPDGEVLAYLGPEGEVVVLNTQTGREILAFREFEPCGGAPVIGFSPDGRWLVGAIPWWVSAGSGEQTWASVVWDMTTGHVARVFPGWLFFLPDGQLLVVGSSGSLPSLTMWDGVLGARSRVLRLPWLQAGLLSVSPDGQHAAFGLADGTIRFWELGAEHEVALLDLKAVLAINPEVESRLAAALFSPDGNLLLTAVWTPSVGKLQVHLWRIGSLLDGRLP